MSIPIYQVDAFASELFSGNPAAVCILDEWIDDGRLRAIAAENNLSETAFLVKAGAGLELRWFTPTVEVPLCGHATLAAAYVQFVCLKSGGDRIEFQTRRSGRLVVTRKGDIFEMDFPAKPAQAQSPPSGLHEALGVEPLQVLRSQEVLLAVLDSQETVLRVQPSVAMLEQLDCLGVIITARGDRSDFVSRCFAPRLGIPEDPATGSAHCTLTPYWASVLGKKDLHALQVSKRGGELWCRDAGERVKISGKAALYLEGTITV